ncbi:sensor histidine kinase [Marinicella sp. W31]|uniref:sensor histidine kinase n=1 Tax=Marinicella sp. W31 TaxID=3023713 RepID=UPI0037567E6E
MRYFSQEHPTSTIGNTSGIVNTLIHIKNKSGYLIFWALVFLINTGPHWQIYSTATELIITVGLLTSLQFLVAYFAIHFSVPVFLNQGRVFLFFIFLIGSAVLVSEINIVVRYWYLEPTYAASYERFLELYGDKSFRQRMVSLWTLKYIFFTKIPLFLYPAIILIANDFHQRQRDVLELSQQKQKAELDALKNQLNPHFIFNTLNNLYTLALKKSDDTPLVIEKLSHILDYVLYRCQHEFVALTDEIELIGHYISLEKIRYGKRVEIDFQHQVNHDVKIAPLILLTLIENAFKHSTKEELGRASIQIKLKASQEHLMIEMCNTKPRYQKQPNADKEPIGLANLRKQLALIYPQNHDLMIEESDRSFRITLEIQHP